MLDRQCFQTMLFAMFDRQCFKPLDKFCKKTIIKNCKKPQKEVRAMKVLRAFYSNFFKQCFNDLFEVFENNIPYGQMCAILDNNGAWIYVKPYADIYMDFPPKGFQTIDLDELEVEEEDAIELKFDMLVPILHSVSFAPASKITIVREATHGIEQKLMYVKKNTLFYGKVLIDREKGFYIFL
jgi:hypothetical protein